MLLTRPWQKAMPQNNFTGKIKTRRSREGDRGRTAMIGGVLDETPAARMAWAWERIP